MCLAIPSKIVSINGKKGIVDMGGIKKFVSEFDKKPDNWDWERGIEDIVKNFKMKYRV